MSKAIAIFFDHITKFYYPYNLFLDRLRFRVSTRHRYDLAALSTVNEPLIHVMLLCALNACKTRVCVCMPVLCVQYK